MSSVTPIAILSRVQEELEKTAEPAVGIVHKLMRMDDPNIRGRILEKFLAPQVC